MHVFLTSALVGAEWSASRPCHFNPCERHPAAIAQEVGWAPEPVWTTWRPHRDLNSDLSVLQPVGSRYTDYATAALVIIIIIIIIIIML
jgi:hypothetical protein